MQTCNKCREDKPIDNFRKYKNKKGETRNRRSCKACEHEHFKEWRSRYNNLQSSKERMRDNALLRNYGITRGDYKSMFIEQQGLCKICNEVSEDTLCVDHCHTTGKVRGLLCKSCNMGLGKFKDNVLYLQRAIDYVSTQ